MALETDGKVEIFTPYIRLKNGRKVYPKSAKVFRILVKPRPSSEVH